MKISFIGLGAMGYPMAGHLVDDHEVVVWNRTAQVAERHAAFEVLNSGSGRSFVSETLLPPRVLEGEWPLMFRLALHEKDLRIAEAMSQSERVSSPLVSLTTQLYTAATRNLGADADYVEVVKYLARMNGEEW